ncbi:MAG: hypothetical protein AAGJ95_10165 [Cyanobacteria bacterium J06554_11]
MTVINDELAAAGMPVTLEASEKRGSLVLRGTFPPKPRSKKQRPHQQRLRLHSYDTPAGLEYAKAAAFRVGAQLLRNEFEWPLEPDDEDRSRSTVGYWVERFKQRWLETQTGESVAIDKRWRENYWYPCFKHLDPARKLTSPYLELFARKQWRPDSRSRQRGVQLLQRLTEMAGIDADFSKHKGKYNPKNVVREIPTDLEIESAIDGIKNRDWQWIAGMMAAYNLRDHEAFLCSVEWRRYRDADWLVALVPDDTKTGRRAVMPLPREWVERWKLYEVKRPNVTAILNKDYGDRVSTQFKRMEIPFQAYSLRHAWNVRAALDAKMPTAVAAQMAGHDPGTNLRVYQKHIGEARAVEAYLEAIQPDAGEPVQPQTPDIPQD